MDTARRLREGGASGVTVEEAARLGEGATAAGEGEAKLRGVWEDVKAWANERRGMLAVWIVVGAVIGVVIGFAQEGGGGVVLRDWGRGSRSRG